MDNSEKQNEKDNSEKQNEKDNSEKQLGGRAEPKLK